MSEHPQQAPQRLPPPAPDARIQAMIAILLANQAQICNHPTGTLELHFHHTSVKAKITLHLPS